MYWFAWRGVARRYMFVVVGTRFKSSRRLYLMHGVGDKFYWLEQLLTLVSLTFVREFTFTTYALGLKELAWHAVYPGSRMHSR